LGFCAGLAAGAPNILDRMAEFAVATIGRDRPGIVAAVCEVLLEHGANIEDSQMTILRGHFTMTLIVSLRDDSAPETLSKLEQGLARVRERLGLEALSVSEVEHLDAAGPDPSHIVTVYGVDHPGIVHAVAATLAEQQVNITDLTTRVFAGEDETPVYAMMLEVAIPPDLDPGELERHLRAIATEQNVELSFRQLEQALL
jgi:glycine cleavage system transcriptional repressor